MDIRPRTVRPGEERELFTAVVGDVMDRQGLLHQFLPAAIQPLRDDMIVIGRAMPVLGADFFADVRQSEFNPLLAQPFGLMLRALDDLKPLEVYVCTGGSLRYAQWGELMSTGRSSWARLERCWTAIPATRAASWP